MAVEKKSEEKCFSCFLSLLDELNKKGEDDEMIMKSEKNIFIKEVKPDFYFVFSNDFMRSFRSLYC